MLNFSNLIRSGIVKFLAVCGILVMGISEMAKAGPDEPPPAVYVLPQNPAQPPPPPPPPPAVDVHCPLR